MKFFRVHFLVAAPGLRLFVFAEAQDKHGRAEFAHFGIVLQFFNALLGRMGLSARNPAEHGGQIQAREY